ncbi:MAG TPA: ester cyclase [Acidimicrobiales bacterium]|nr:ester cyclase [Acidimicrobiales bacterium]
MGINANKAIVEQFDEILNTRRLDQLEEVCGPEMINHSLAPGRPPGLEGTRQWLSTDGQKFESFRWSELTVVAEEDLVVQFGVRCGDWPGGSFRGFEVPAGKYKRDTVFMYRVRDDRIVERWAVNDHLSMLLQLGAIPDPCRPAQIR